MKQSMVMVCGIMAATFLACIGIAEDAKFIIKWNEDEKPEKKTELRKPKKKEEEDF